MILEFLVCLNAVAHLHVASCVDGAVHDVAACVRIDHCRLVGLCRVNHIDDRISSQMQGLGCGRADIVQSWFSADPAGYLKFYHRLFIKNRPFWIPEPRQEGFVRPEDNGNIRQSQS